MAGGYLLIDKVGVNPFGGPAVSGREVVVETQQLRARFSKLGAFSDSYMVFGGNADRATNSVSDAILATLAVRHAELISQTYPDFHMCSSPGAAQAQRLVEDMTFVAANRAARRALAEVVDLHGRRVRSGGERTCVSVSGVELVLDSVQLKHDGQDITHETAGAFERSNFYLAERVELPSCEALLH